MKANHEYSVPLRLVFYAEQLEKYARGKTYWRAYVAGLFARHPGLCIVEVVADMAHSRCATRGTCTVVAGVSEGHSTIYLYEN